MSSDTQPKVQTFMKLKFHYLNGKNYFDKVMEYGWIVSFEIVSTFEI